MAARYSIVGRTRELEVAPSLAKDFTLGDSHSFELKEILHSGQGGGPRYTLYCLDPRDGTALFVETSRSCVLEDAPFFYSAQYENAQAVIKISRAEFFHLAKLTEDPGPRLGFIQSVGRSGTTLASRAFGTCEGVYSLSEPDTLLQLLAFSPSSKEPDSSWKCSDERAHDALCDAVIRILCAEALQAKRYHRVILKPRSQFCEAFAQILRLYPKSETLFLSRSPLSWLESVFSSFLRDLDCDDDEVVSSFERALGSYIPLIQSRTLPGRVLSMGTLWALHYVSALRELEAAQRAGLSVYSLSFEDLEASPRCHFEAIFQRWGLAWDDAALTSILAQDSQAGSGLAKESAGRATYVVPAQQMENGAAVFREFGFL